MNARKIIIVITDGEKFKDPLQYSDVIPEAKKANIIRYAIGVRPFLLAPPDAAFTSPRKQGWRAPPPHVPLCCRWEMLSRHTLPGRS